MNHIFLAGEHILVAYVEDGEYPRPAGSHDMGVVDMTNWPVDIMNVNQTPCMVFADPNFMTTMGTGFTSNGTLITGALVLRDNYLYRHTATEELDQIAEFPLPWYNLSRNWYVATYAGELYDELTTAVRRADNMNDTKKFQDELGAKIMLIFKKFKAPVKFVYSVNTRTGGMSRMNANRLKDFT